jgi:hypothetical protein
MTPDDGEPMPPRPEEVGALPPVRMSATLKADLWARVEASAAIAGAYAPQREAAPTSAAPAPVGAGVASPVVKWALTTLVGGIAIGAAVDRYVFPPLPIVVEKVVVRREEVRVEVPGAVGPAPQISAPAPRAPARKPEPASRPPAAPEAVAPGPNLERQLLEGARTALVRRDASSAIEMLEKLRRSFPGGQLLEERDSLQVQAFQQAKRDDDAKAAAKAFLERYPHSVFGPAVEAVLESKK